ncbi:hypothetical protein [Actinacidiphila oryziradicis]|uniref:Uncharacterized protein n=1 Tax=Actinacidiphila oryziradicis TaxID=2571141 RepID=A0A4U0RFY9_9ACTN|nr:hypothetical protein [Actinacidiphila oryziradicis]TJZ94433.1 hypothetical protein FCI23_53725 [Actinacidiphila oryziradicis]
MSEQETPWVGDQVHDEDAGREAIVTNVINGTYYLRPLVGGGQWENENPERLRITVPRRDRTDR